MTSLRFALYDYELRILRSSGVASQVLHDMTKLSGRKTEKTRVSMRKHSIDERSDSRVMRQFIFNAEIVWLAIHISLT